MIISKTPLRVSIVGGGTDLKDFYKKNKGQVISFTINKYIYVIVKKRFDDLIVLNYTKNEIVKSVNDIKHDLIRECCKAAGIDKSIEITTLADIPSQGSGLGSSSAVTVGLLNALYTFNGEQPSTEFLARKACEIEIDILKNPIGKQDQYIVAYGGFKKFIFNSDESVSIKNYKFNLNQLLILGSNLLLHYTNQTRNASKILTNQKQNIEKKIKELKSISMLVDKLDPLLDKHNYSMIGDLLEENWNLKRTLSKGITSPFIDEMVNNAKTGGAQGCKISGAGGGGFLLSYVDRNNQNSYRDKMSHYRELPFMIESSGSKIIFNIN